MEFENENVAARVVAASISVLSNNYWASYKYVSIIGYRLIDCLQTNRGRIKNVISYQCMVKRYLIAKSLRLVNEKIKLYLKA